MTAKELIENVRVEMEKMPLEQHEAFLNGLANLNQQFRVQGSAAADSPSPWPNIHAQAALMEITDDQSTTLWERLKDHVDGVASDGYFWYVPVDFD